jgi:hypothetical protein
MIFLLPSEAPEGKYLDATSTNNAEKSLTKSNLRDFAGSEFCAVLRATDASKMIVGRLPGSLGDGESLPGSNREKVPTKYASSHKKNSLIFLSVRKATDPIGEALSADLRRRSC